MAGTMFNGISIGGGGSANVLIEDNFVQSYADMGTRIIVRDGSDNVTVTGNTVSDVIVNLVQSNSAPNTNFVLGRNTTIPGAAVGDNSALNAWVSQHSDAADQASVAAWLALPLPTPVPAPGPAPTPRPYRRRLQPRFWRRSNRPSR
jgi:hypothetical protein